MQNNFLRTNDIDTKPDTWDEDDIERMLRDIPDYDDYRTFDAWWTNQAEWD